MITSKWSWPHGHTTPHYATLRFQHNVSWSVGGEDANVVPKQRPELGKDIDIHRHRSGRIRAWEPMRMYSMLSYILENV